MPERYRATVARGHDRREIEYEVASWRGAIDGAKTAAAREFDWPYYEITFLRAHKIATAEQVAADAQKVPS